MYTRCPHCSTIFDVTDEDLNARQGRVRCGRCRGAFNASWNLLNSLPGGDQPGIELSPAGESAGGGGGDTPSSAPGAEPSKGQVGATQKWSVSAVDGPGQDTAQGNKDEVVTETLSLAEVASTEEVENLIRQAGEDALSSNVEPDSGGAEPEGLFTTGVPNEVDEEIVIEAPVNLWNVNDEGNGIESGDGPPAEKRGVLPALGKPESRIVPIARHPDDVKLVQIPHPKPIQTAAWSLAAVILTAAVFWQLKQYYISELAEVESLRDPLETVCRYASCTVPPRTDIKRIDLVSTSVDPHPATPGALRVSAILINRAVFEQPFPPLEVTLTDKAGDVVGRRTYLPHEYRTAPPGDMSPNVLERADLDLAQPAHSAVGYEIQLVAR